MKIYFMSSGVGSDAGGWHLEVVNGKIVVVRDPGWNPEARLELTHALKIIREATSLKTPALREGAMREVMEFAQKELAQYVKEGGVLVLT